MKHNDIIMVYNAVHVILAKTCQQNEVYNECGTACTKTCATKDVMFKCTANCVAGCFCQDGYIRENTGGKCILVGDCR